MRQSLSRLLDLVLVRRGERQSGQTLAIVAISLVAIMAMAAAVLDGALLFDHRRQLQNAADGAALAGERLLHPPGHEAEAVSAAYDYANRNGVPASQVESVTVGTEPVYGYPIITVRVRRNVSLFFARAIGIPNRDVGTVATGIVTPLIVKGDIWPWGTTNEIIDAVSEEADPYGTVELKLGSPGSIHGNFMAVQLGQAGGSQYRDNIENGYNGPVPGPIPPNTWEIKSETGNLVGPTKQGVKTVIDETESGDYPSYCVSGGEYTDPDCGHSNCPNWGLVPVLQGGAWSDINGKEPETVIGFAVFQLVGYGGEESGTGQSVVTGKFLNTCLWGEGDRNLGGTLEGLIGVSLWPSGSSLP